MSGSSAYQIRLAQTALIRERTEGEMSVCADHVPNSSLVYTDVSLSSFTNFVVRTGAAFFR